MCPHRQLGQGFFAGDIEHLVSACEHRRDLQQQCAFACTRIATNQDHGAGYQASAKHPIQFTETGGDSLHFLGFDVRQSSYFTLCAGKPAHRLRDGADVDP